MTLEHLKAEARERMKQDYSEETHYSGGYDEYETRVHNQALTDVQRLLGEDNQNKT